MTQTFLVQRTCRKPSVVNSKIREVMQNILSLSALSACTSKCVLLQVPPDVEEFVKDWVTKNYEASPGNAIKQAIVYRHFAASMQSLGRKQGLNPVLLSNCVR